MMCKENIIRFFMLVEKDEELKSKYSGLTAKYKENDRWNAAMLEDVAELAKKNGYDLRVEDIREYQKKEADRLPDEELDEVAGGRGQIEYSIVYLTYTSTTTTYCDLAPDNQTFAARFNQMTDNGCPNFMFVGCGCNKRICVSCKNLQTHYSEPWKN